MSLLSLAELRALVNTPLDDARLQSVIDREEAEVVRRFGAPYVDAETTVTETHPGGGPSLFLRRGIASVDTVVERLSVDDSDPATLESDDYRAWPDQGRLDRRPAGARWGAEVSVTFVPEDDRERRKLAIVELVRLALERTAMKSESVAGEYSYQAPDWQAARAEILRGLGCFHF